VNLIRVLKATVKGPGAAPSTRLINGLQRPRTSGVSGQPPRFSPRNGRHPQGGIAAYQQNPEAVTRWKAETYPAIRAEAAQLGATIYFVDEAGVRSDYHGGTTWAPVGQTRWWPPLVTGSGST
jgi:hypothetical protein